MDKSSKILLIILVILIAWSVIMTYNRTIIKKDFYIEESELEEENENELDAESEIEPEL